MGLSAECGESWINSSCPPVYILIGNRRHIYSECNQWCKAIINAERFREMGTLLIRAIGCQPLITHFCQWKVFHCACLYVHIHLLRNKDIQYCSNSFKLVKFNFSFEIKVNKSRILIFPHIPVKSLHAALKVYAPLRKPLALSI